MPTLSYQTAGESHGPGMFAIINGLPAGLRLDFDFINAELRRRQGGYGRGGRQRIETDTAEPLTGVRLGRTIGSPVVLKIMNKDSRLDDVAKTPPVHLPRPGHADLAGSIKYLTTDCRETLERASARETAARVAAGAVARLLLREMRESGMGGTSAQGIEVFGFVRSILDAQWDGAVREDNWKSLVAARDASETYCPDGVGGGEGAVTKRQCEIIRQAKIDKDTVGGLVEAHVFGLPPGIGSTMDWRDRLDARLAYAVMGIQAFKAVEIGLGKECALRPGSKVHDPIRFDAARVNTHSLGFVRDTNNAGGTEGGMSNGAPIVVRGTMKPISTLLRGMPSVDLNTKQPATSAYERSDICAVSAASVVMENVVAFEIARAVLEKFGGDSVEETRGNYERFMMLARMLPLPSDPGRALA
ncbi:MAG: chorismate synthase [Phycisphaeraceae bacterium]|nr:chorismate synthase [Phycisphaeraceae bacterium]MBX3405555.1 chorismate synthase [Phycisphaeraceae bacterium]